ncbi:MAG TPA: hypothetical protein VGJ20_00615 [Xanthobacteraceae bacterium]|jgi:hypothetical protein
MTVSVVLSPMLMCGLFASCAWQCRFGIRVKAVNALSRIEPDVLL